MRNIPFIIIFAYISLLFGGNEETGEKHYPGNSLNSSGYPVYTLLNINNFSAWISDDGMSGYNPVNNTAGVIYPRGTANIIFQDGFIWGGFARDGKEPSLRVGGQTYNVGTQPGRILSVGVPQDLSDPRVRIYRIRRDWQTAPDNDLRRDAAELLNIDSAQVTQSQIYEVRAQYAADWNEWPVDMGAPFYDLNGNGIYEPLLGETPGLANADQAIWFVCNDLNMGRTASLYGSPPIGIELQVTMWGYNRSDALGQAFFRRYRFINKSGALFDSVFVAQWSDTDIGNGGDDFAGCDSVLNLGYAYNGYPADQEFQKFNVPPPAVGYDLLQGPAVPSPGNTAVFDFKKRPDYKNLPMTSFTAFATGGSVSDPVLRDYDGTLMWYNMLNGYIPDEDTSRQISYIHGSGPLAGKPTKFWLNGDPVFGTGDIDGQGNNRSPGARRIVLSSGPFTMQPGDTQEIIVAVVGGIGESNLLSVKQMKENDRMAQGAYDNLFEFVPTAVQFAASPDYLSESQTRVHFHAVNTEADAIQLSVRKYDGSEVASLSLHDDGLHGDGSAADGVFGNDWETAPLAEGLYVDAQVNYSGGQSYTWHRIQEALTTAGPVRISRFILGSDNLNHDGAANPGENIRYTLEIENQTAFDFSDLLIRQTEPAISPALQNLSAPRGDQIIPALTANSSFSWDYSSEGKFYQFDIASGLAGDDSVRIAVQLSDGQYNLWRDTVSVWVAALPVEPRDRLMSRIEGDCAGQLGYRLVDPSLLAEHTYQVSFNSTLPGGAVLFELQDLTSGETLLTAQPYPDQYGHNSQVVDGIMVTRGTTIPYNKTGRWDWISSGERWLSGMGDLSTFYGGFDLGREFFGSTLTHGDYHSVEITFDPGMQTNCAVYRRDLVYQYSGTGIFYGAAYDISDTLNPRRVNIVFAEDNNSKPADLIWNPDTTGLGGREYLFIMDSDYDPVTAGGYNDTNFGPDADVVWAGWTRVKPGYSFLQTPADLYLFLDKAIGQGDVFQFTPQWTGTGSAGLQPLTFELLQNYPNPFNPATHFRFNLARQVKVRLEIYNVLGQRVRILINHKMGMGRYNVKWDGRNEAGNYMGSGVYFYRLSAGDYVKTRKMILMK